jgi:hypothetical protein
MGSEASLQSGTVAGGPRRTGFARYRRTVTAKMLDAGYLRDALEALLRPVTRRA